MRQLAKVTVLAAVLAARVAWPCSGATCEQYFGPVPGPGSTVPANAPALGVQLAQYSESAWDGGTSVTVGIGPVGVSLLHADGGAVAATTVPQSHEFWLELDAGLTQGDTLTLTTDFGGNCPASSTVLVGAPAPLPASSATVRLANLRVREGLGGFCGGPLGVVQHAQLTLEAAAEMVPWLPLARWELEVDGQNYATSDFGAVTSTPRTGVPAESGLHPIDTFHVQCRPPADGGSLDARLSAGTHQVRLLARIVGVPVPVPSNTLTVTLDCVPTADDDGGTLVLPEDGGQPPDDGGLTSLDAGSGPADGGTGGPGDGGAGSTTPPPAGCGCGALPLPAALVALLALGRRRRSTATGR